MNGILPKTFKKLTLSEATDENVINYGEIEFLWAQVTKEVAT